MEPETGVICIALVDGEEEGPQYGIPELVELTVTGIEVLDETERVAKALGK